MISLRLIVPVERQVCVSDDGLHCDPHCVYHVGACMGRSENCALPGPLTPIVNGERIGLCLESEVKL